MITKKDIIDAWVVLRKHNMSIPDETLDFIRDAALEKYAKTYPIDCRYCIHDGEQQIYPSGCTGCGAHEEYRNFMRKQ